MNRSSAHRRMLGLGPSGLAVEFLAGIPILMVLYLCDVTFQSVLIPRARMMEALNFVPVLKIAAVAEYGTSGNWADREYLLAPGPGPTTEWLTRVQIADGSFGLLMDAEKIGIDPASWGIAEPMLRLSIIRSVPKNGKESHFPLWVCGYATPIDGYERIGLPNLTNIPPVFLPPVCKQ